MPKTTLKIIDQVNVKFENLDPHTRRKMVESVKFFIQTARHTPAYKLGRWDGTVSFANVSGATYLNLLDTILPIITDAGYDIDIDDQRTPYNFNFPLVTEDFLAHKVWPKGHVAEGQPIMLRDYQVTAINTYMANLQCMQSISTGAGKCLVTNTELEIEVDANSDFGKFLIDKRQLEIDSHYRCTRCLNKIKIIIKTIMKITLPIGELFDAIEEFKKTKFQDNLEQNIKDLNIQIKTPVGMTTINHAIKKEQLPTASLTFDTGHILKCATKHILINEHNHDVFVETLNVGDEIKTETGMATIIAKSDNGIHDCYDIGIASPHVYYDANGILHHNTLMTAAISTLCESYGGTIVVVPSKSLVTQTEEDYKNLGMDVGVYFGERKEMGKTHTICTWQSLSSLIKNSKDAADDEYTIADLLDGVVAVIVDEAHSVKGSVLKDMLVGPLAHVPIRLGLTGTIPKEDEDKMSLLVSLGPVVGEIRAADLQEQGVLAQCHVNIIQLDDSHVEYRDYAAETKYLTGDIRRVTWLANLINQISTEGNTLVLVAKIETGELIQSLIPDSVFVNGSTKSKDRIEEYKDVRTATNKVMVATYGVAAVGLDIPRLFNVVLIEPGKSFVRVIQSIGRGIRKAGDKDAVNIWDLTSNLKYSAKHLVKRKEFYKDAAYPMSVTKVDYRDIEYDAIATTTTALKKSSTKGLNKNQKK